MSHTPCTAASRVARGFPAAAPRRPAAQAAPRRPAALAPHGCLSCTSAPPARIMFVMQHLSVRPLRIWSITRLPRISKKRCSCTCDDSMEISHSRPFWPLSVSASEACTCCESVEISRSKAACSLAASTRTSSSRLLTASRSWDSLATSRSRPCESLETSRSRAPCSLAPSARTSSIRLRTASRSWHTWPASSVSRTCRSSQRVPRRASPSRHAACAAERSAASRSSWARSSATSAAGAKRWPSSLPRASRADAGASPSSR
mmetsp:Transcript_34752/g.96090  ORF Transcript_34752/g.96090 Transcript_34752/m.96090 type:complete len:261 (+) Transcript_34752:368-1150(+)